MCDWTSSLGLDVREDTFITKDVAAFQHGGGVGDFRLAERAGFVLGGGGGGESWGGEIEGLGC
jgi:hypothetical protein